MPQEAKIILQGGKPFSGYSFGAPRSAAGEVIFNTSMVGYPEALTDPSYRGQILVLTYPLIGNYGVPSLKKLESDKIQAAGLVISDLNLIPSHHQSSQSLASWLDRENIPGVYGVDTRAITKILRERGSTLGKIIVQEDVDFIPHLSPNTLRKGEGFIDSNKMNLVAQVAIGKKQICGAGKIKALVIDCGLKNSIIRCLASRGCQVIRVPYDYNFLQEQYDGLVISNGPGDPTMCKPTIANLKIALKQNKPILGICLGNQLLALAAGAKTYKLKYGHHSSNQPCVDVRTGRCYITSQNHGFAVDAKSLPSGCQQWFFNANDGTNEGIRHQSKPIFSVQFHPEASPGPNDTGWVFDEFIKTI